MKRYAFVLGGTSDRGPEALILDGCQIIGQTSLAVAGKVCNALNRPTDPQCDAERVQMLHGIIQDQHKILTQHLETREKSANPPKDNDDMLYAKKLLDRAGQIVQGAA